MDTDTPIPAHLGFLAIYNPSLGHTDDTLADQIVYYASTADDGDPQKQQKKQKQKRRRRHDGGRPTDGLPAEERHERLRQIGLAQGMASFSRGFASGAAVDAIDTDRTRVVLHELEPGWWILASINLTRTPLPPRLPIKGSSAAAPEEEQFDYSTREMKPGNLLLADLTRAHRTFLLHHDTCLDALLERSGRPRFAAVLARYWDLFLSTWSVLLHGNPARDVHPGIVVAASGELGVGVGEEERGSGERDVLEGLVDGVYGLVDLVVARYGDEHGDEQGEEGPWLGAGREPGPEDGAVFLGTGALSRRSLRDVTAWMGDLYTWGEHAYGVIDSPSSVRRRRGKKGRRHREHKGASTEAGAAGTKPAGEDVTKPTQDVGGAAAEAAETEVPAAETAAPAEAPATETTAPTAPAPEAPAEAAAPEASASAHAEAPDAPDAPGKLGKMVSYLKMGYGTYWTLPVRTETTDTPPPPATTQRPESEGYFLIGLKGDIYEDAGASDASDSSDNSRTMLRTLTVDLAGPANNEELSSSTDGTASTRLRVVVYACRPFLFTLLFQTHTDSLALDSSYRSLHQRLSPLRRPLLSSTRYRPDRPQQPQSSTGLLGGNSSAAAAAIYDLVWDPTQLTVHSTMPSIPETHDPSATEPWSRADALNTHTHILAVHASTNSTSGHALERSQKTSRGWWIVWTRLLRHHAPVSPPANLSTIQESVSEDEREASDAEEEGAEEEGPPPTVDKDIYLVRRASDHVRARDAAASGRLASGIGVDTRRYVEDLLSLL